jgi:hypothetical protein
MSTDEFYSKEYYCLERSVTYPVRDIPVLKWWEGVYDHVFVAFHPFFAVPSYSPTSAAYGPIHMDVSDPDVFVELVKSPPSRPNAAPKRFEDTIKRSGQQVRWAHVNDAIGGYPFADFCLATWMAAVEFRRRDSDEKIISAILQFAHQTDLYLPTQDRLPSILEASAGEAFERIGIREVTLDNEFNDYQALTSVSSLSEKSSSAVPYSDRLNAIYDANRNLLIINAFDNISSLVAMKDSVRHKVRPEEIFEGFYATRDMYCDWMNPHDFFERKIVHPN